MNDQITQLSHLDLAYGDLQHELDITRPFLERLPEDQLDWCPHPKSYSLRQLAFHISNLLLWQKMSLIETGFNLGGSPPPEQVELPGKEAILENFDNNRKGLQEALDNFSEEELGAPWTLRHGDHEIFTIPKASVLRQFSISHMIHHRGQLSLYLRLLDVPVPPTYGPTADEQMGG